MRCLLAVSSPGGRPDGALWGPLHEKPDALREGSTLTAQSQLLMPPSRRGFGFNVRIWGDTHASGPQQGALPPAPPLSVRLGGFGGVTSTPLRWFAHMRTVFCRATVGFLAGTGGIHALASGWLSSLAVAYGVHTEGRSDGRASELLSPPPVPRCAQPEVTR